MQPTQRIISIVNYLDKGISDFLEVACSIESWGEFEAHVGVFSLGRLMIKNIEGICLLAKEDMFLLPSAMVLTRAVFEISMKALWLMNSDDPFENEIRWLAYLKEDEDYFEQVAKDFINREIHSHLTQRAEIIRSFRTQVEEKLPAGYSPLTKTPSFRMILKELQLGIPYALYKRLCQFPHGTHAATEIYARNLGPSMELGEFISENDWHLPLSLCWLCLSTYGERFLGHLGGKTHFPDLQFRSEIEGELKILSML